VVFVINFGVGSKIVFKVRLDFSELVLEKDPSGYLVGGIVFFWFKILFPILFKELFELVRECIYCACEEGF